MAMQLRKFLNDSVAGFTGLFLLAGDLYLQVQGAQGIAKAVRISEASAASREFRRLINARIIATAAARSETSAKRSDTTAAKTPEGRFSPAQSTPARTVLAKRTAFAVTDQVDYPARLADTMEIARQERELILNIFRATKTAFEQQVAAKGRKNNV